MRSHSGGGEGSEGEGPLPHTEVHLRVRPEMTVQELKHAIENCAQIPSENQILIYRGNRLLSPDETLQQAGVGPAAVLHLVLQLRRPQVTVTRGAALLRGITSRALAELAAPDTSAPLASAPAAPAANTATATANTTTAGTADASTSSSDAAGAGVRLEGKTQSFPQMPIQGTTTGASAAAAPSRGPQPQPPSPPLPPQPVVPQL